MVALELCGQCGHPIHTVAHETKYPDGSAEYDGGCPVMVYLRPLSDGGGYYHEHCDCSSGEIDPGDEHEDDA